MKTGSRKAFALIVKREWRILLSRPLYPFVMIVAPLLCMFFFTTLLHEGQPEKMPTGVVDCDNSATSRKIIRTLDAFQHVDIVKKYASVTEARRDVQEGHIYGFFYFPERFGEDATAQRRPTLSFYVGYTYLIAASLLYQNMKTMAELSGASAVLTTLTAKGATYSQAMNFVQPISIDKHPLQNPWLNYSVYLNNTLVPGLISLLIFLMTSFSVSSEVKRGTSRELLRLSHYSIVRALFAKLLPQTLVWFGMMLLCNFTFYGLLSFPHNSGIMPMISASLLLVLASQGMGLLFFGIVPQVRFCMAMCSLWGVVSISICGFTCPVMAMYPAIQGLSLLFPLRYFHMIYCDQALNGFPLLYSWTSYVALAVFALLPLLLLRRIKYSYMYDQYMP